MLQVCRHRLAPHLTTLSMDKSLFDVGNNRNNNANSSEQQQQRQASMSPMPPPSVGPDGTPSNSGGAPGSMPSATDAQGQNPTIDGYISSSSGNVSSLLEKYLENNYYFWKLFFC